MSMKIVNRDEAEKDLAFQIRKIFDDDFSIDGNSFDSISISLRYDCTKDGKVSFDRWNTKFVRSQCRENYYEFFMKEFNRGDVLETDPETLAKDLLDKFEKNHFYAARGSEIWVDDNSGFIETFKTYEEAKKYCKDEVCEYSLPAIISRRKNIRVN